MDRKWIEKTIAEKSVLLDELKQGMLDRYAECSIINNDRDKKIIKAELDRIISDYQNGKSCGGEVLASMGITYRLGKAHPEWSIETYNAVCDHIESITGLGKIFDTAYIVGFCGWADRRIDSDPVEFDGDIIITDPCYIIKDDGRGADWQQCGYGEDLGALGIKNYMARDTIYGDWGCTVVDTNTGEEIGEFCADAGMVAVLSLDEVLRYNPDFDYHKERKWTTTLIEDFKGTVQFVVEHHTGIYPEDGDFHPGEEWEDFSVHVVGHGINKKTGRRIDFRSSQSSL